jgi:hypothetical protein
MCPRRNETAGATGGPSSLACPGINLSDYSADSVTFNLRPLGDPELPVVRLEITTRSQASVGGATSGGAPCLAAAARVDEVKKIFDQAVAMKMYAFQVRDPDLIGPSTEIKSRATYVPEEHEIELLVRAGVRL